MQNDCRPPFYFLTLTVLEVVDVEANSYEKPRRLGTARSSEVGELNRSFRLEALFDMVVRASPCVL